jgi:hypothetical protein
MFRARAVTKPMLNHKGRGGKSRGTEEPMVFMKTYTADLSNQDTTEYFEFEGAVVSCTAELQKMNHSEQFVLYH